jgi:hypothetical protein
MAIPSVVRCSLPASPNARIAADYAGRIAAVARTTSDAALSRLQRVELGYPPLELMAMSKVPAAVRAHLAKIGARGGKHASGAGGRGVSVDVSAEARSRRRRDLVRKRWAKAKKG